MKQEQIFWTLIVAVADGLNFLTKFHQTSNQRAQTAPA